jgi:hypothetical protein
MCGACGVRSRDWLSVFLGTSYARTVVARFLGDLTGGNVVTSSSSGWMLRSRSGAPLFAATLDEVLDEVVSDARMPVEWADFERSITRQPDHRPVLIQRDEVPVRHRAAAAHTVLGAARPETALYRLVALALGTRRAGLGGASISLLDHRGEWDFAL